MKHMLPRCTEPRTSKTESTNLQAQLKFFLTFYCLLRVSVFGKAITRELKIHTKKENLNKLIQRTSSDS
jgi:hypothetical protein